MATTSLAPLHQTLPQATYVRGSTCIDFIMATPGIQNATIAAGYLDFYGGIWHSDHRGIFIDVSTNVLFNCTTSDIKSRPTRIVSSNNKKQVFRFIHHLKKLDCLPQILSTLQQLASQTDWNAAHDEVLEDLDAQFTNSLSKAESVCTLPHRADWHP
jgi:hypothetical protein